MTGFELRISGLGCDHSTSCATTCTASKFLRPLKISLLFENINSCDVINVKNNFKVSVPSVIQSLPK